MSASNNVKQSPEIVGSAQAKPQDDAVTLSAIQGEPANKPAESVFDLALRAKSERALNPIIRVTKAPARIKPTSKIKGWFCTHLAAPFGPIDVFHPKDEGGFSDEPVFVLPALADELRMLGCQFENAVREMNAYLVSTMGGALYLVLVPLPDPSTGRHHAAIEQKIETLEAAKLNWKRLEWNKGERQYEELTAEVMLEEPKWPDDVSPASILHRAFGERNVIKSIDDPLIAKFRGEA